MERPAKEIQKKSTLRFPLASDPAWESHPQRPQGSKESNSVQSQLGECSRHDYRRIRWKDIERLRQPFMFWEWMQISLSSSPLPQWTSCEVNLNYPELISQIWGYMNTIEHPSTAVGLLYSITKHARSIFFGYHPNQLGCRFLNSVFNLRMFH